jgi:hypothetical protein
LIKFRDAYILIKEQLFFEAHKAELREKYLGKHTLISGEEMKGVYDTDGEAYMDATKTMKPGTFMIKIITQNDQDSIQRYMNRVYA